MQAKEKSNFLNKEYTDRENLLYTCTDSRRLFDDRTQMNYEIL